MKWDEIFIWCNFKILYIYIIIYICIYIIIYIYYIYFFLLVKRGCSSLWGLNEGMIKRKHKIEFGVSSIFGSWRWNRCMMLRQVEICRKVRNISGLYTHFISLSILLGSLKVKLASEGITGSVLLPTEFFQLLMNGVFLDRICSKMSWYNVILVINILHHFTHSFTPSGTFF